MKFKQCEAFKVWIGVAFSFSPSPTVDGSHAIRVSSIRRADQEIIYVREVLMA